MLLILNNFSHLYCFLFFFPLANVVLFIYLHKYNLLTLSLNYKTFKIYVFTKLYIELG